MSYQIVSLEQGTDAWHEFRKDKIGASDAAAIMGVSPWATIYEKWMEKCSFTDKPKDNPYMRRGRELESEARERFIEMSGIPVKPVVIQSTIYPWLIASLDGLSIDGKIAVELKCPGVYDHNLAIAGVVPHKYHPQLQHTLMLLGLEGMWYYSYDPDVYCMPIYVPRDEAYISRLMPALESFYQCMMQRIPPECRETRTLQMENEEWQDEMHRYQECKAKKEWWELEIEASKKRLIELSGGCEAQGMGFKLSKTVRRGNIDYDAMLKQENIDVNLDQYRKPDTEYWTIKKDK